MKRIFFAVDVVAERALLGAYGSIRNRLKQERINWVPAEQLHITLAFLGDMEEGLISGMVAAVEKILELHREFEITLSAMGVFKDLRDPRVIWIGCTAGPEFQQIKSDLDQVLTGFGYEPDNRVFSPHLTLGRIKGMRNTNHLAKLITLYKDVVFQQQVISQIVLYESRLTPAGPEYIPLKKFILK
jgi:2'-5' RNA ligase